MARVLQVVTELVVGGASLTMLDFAEDLSREHEVLIAHGHIGNPDNPVARRARRSFATYEIPRLVRPIAPRDDAAAVRAFTALCRGLRPDVIHTHSSKAGFIGRAAPTRAGVLLHMVHGWGHTPLDSPLRRVALIGAERLAAHRTTRLIAVSPEVRDEGVMLRIGRPGQYAVIGAPVDMRPLNADFSAARAAARARLGLPAGADVVGWVGRFSPQKDPQTLAAVLSRVLRERHNVHAVLIGDGPERAAVQNRLASEVAEGRVLFAGEVDDVRPLYPAFDVLLHTTRWEGHPRVIREALAERVPVVTAHVSGTGVVSTDTRLGSEVPAADVEAYVAALEGILDSATWRSPIDAGALESLRATGDAPYRLMRELYRATLADAGRQSA